MSLLYLAMNEKEGHTGLSILDWHTVQEMENRELETTGAGKGIPKEKKSVIDLHRFSVAYYSNNQIVFLISSVNGKRHQQDGTLNYISGLIEGHVEVSSFPRLK